MRKRYSFGEILVPAKRSCYGSRDLRDLKTMRQACSVVIAFMFNEDLRFVLKSAKGAGMYDPTAVSLKRGSMCAFRLCMQAAA